MTDEIMKKIQAAANRILNDNKKIVRENWTPKSYEKDMH